MIISHATIKSLRININSFLKTVQLPSSNSAAIRKVSFSSRTFLPFYSKLHLKGITTSTSVLYTKYLHLSTSTPTPSAVIIGGMSFTVTIVRHGQTDFNLKNLVHTCTDGTLNDAGRNEAECLGKFLTNEKFTKVYSSDLQRCQDTAKGVLQNSSNPAPDVVTDTRLRERDYSEWDGRPMKDILAMAKEQKIDPNQITAPGGETYDEAMNRITSFFLELLESRDATDKEENVVLFTHGIIIQFLMRYLDSNQSMYELENFSFDRWKYAGNTARTKFLVGKKGSGTDGRRKITFTCMHDQSHLSEIVLDQVELLKQSVAVP